MTNQPDNAKLTSIPMMNEKIIPLGQVTDYPDRRDAAILFPIQRASSHVRRTLLSESAETVFVGLDRWRCYEISWLNSIAAPMTGMATIEYDCLSPAMVESKSLKLYLTGLNFERFASVEAVEEIIASDLKAVLDLLDIRVSITLINAPHPEAIVFQRPQSINIDRCDNESFTAAQYNYDPSVLSCGATKVTEELCSHSLRTLCPVTGQPDWATVVIRYRGSQIQRSSLFRYIVSFRNHRGYHEECCEQIFVDLIKHCQPELLEVALAFTRRGGIDITPIRRSLGISYDQNFPGRFGRQ